LAAGAAGVEVGVTVAEVAVAATAINPRLK
jgi:hypothetical protein